MSGGPTLTAPRGGGAVAAPAQGGQRGRILAVALELMGEHGVAGTSMRRLAAACELNVATLYHYFPSKAELVRSLLAERQYHERLAERSPAVPPGLPPQERYAALFRLLWEGAGAEESLWRVLISESIHGDTAVRDAVTEVFDALRAGLDAWLADLFPELPGAGAGSTAALARLTASLLVAAVVEDLALGASEPLETAELLAAAFLGGP